MPTNAKAKREARARKARTGESYATARMNTFEEEVVDVPTREQLWERFAKELDDHPVASHWEYFGLRSHWNSPKHRQHLYKLLIRRKGGNRDWWWFEDDISVMPPEFPDDYQTTPAYMKPSGDLPGVLAFAAEKGTPLGFTPSAVDQAIAEVKKRFGMLTPAKNPPSTDRPRGAAPEGFAAVGEGFLAVEEHDDPVKAHMFRSADGRGLVEVRDGVEVLAVFDWRIPEGWRDDGPHWDEMTVELLKLVEIPY